MWVSAQTVPGHGDRGSKSQAKEEKSRGKQSAASEEAIDTIAIIIDVVRS